MTDFLIGCQQRKVCVHFSRFLVVVAGADLGDVLDFATLFFGDEAEFGMNFVILEAVNDGASGFFQTF